MRGLPGSRAVARGLGAGECVAAAFAAAAPARGGALALAIVYLAFAGFVGTCCARTPRRARAAAQARRRCLRACSTSRWTWPRPPRGCSTSSHGARPRPRGSPRWAGDRVPVHPGLALAGWLVVVAVTEVPAAWRAWAPPVGRPASSHADRHLVAEDALSIAGNRTGPSEPLAGCGSGHRSPRMSMTLDRAIRTVRTRRDPRTHPRRGARRSRRLDASRTRRVRSRWPRPLLGAPRDGRCVGPPHVLDLSARQPVLRLLLGVLLHAPGRQQLRLPAEHVRRRLVAVQLRQARACAGPRTCATTWTAR